MINQVNNDSKKEAYIAAGIISLVVAGAAWVWLNSAPQSPDDLHVNGVNDDANKVTETAATNTQPRIKPQISEAIQTIASHQPAIKASSAKDDFKDEEDLFQYLAEEEGLPMFQLNTEYNINDSIPVVGTLVGGIIKQGDITEANEQSPTGDSFQFPEVVKNDNGDWVMVIGDQPIPNRSVRREVSRGKGAVGRAGDTIHFRYDMFSWATGELIESSNDMGGKPLVLTLGDFTQGVQVPNYLHNALLNRAEGTKLQVVFEQAIDGLPQQMNPHDGYVLMVEIDRVVPRTEEEG